MTLEYRTAGESHGPALTVLVEGIPAGVAIDVDLIDSELRRRQGGYGRGGRMAIEDDHVAVLSGVRAGMTIGSPIVLQISNRDSRIEDTPAVRQPRPGHADLAGGLKWLTTDCRAVIERASARETAARVAAGALSRSLLREFGIDLVGYVIRVGEIEAAVDSTASFDELRTARNGNEGYCPDSVAATKMVSAISRAKSAKDTLGGVVEVQVEGHPPGLGSCMRWQDKLDGRLMGALGSIQAIKGVEIGLGFAAAEKPGSEVHDEIEYDASRCGLPAIGFVRGSNNAGGLEGGMTNGERICIRAAMKPISTLASGLGSVDLVTRQPERSFHERSDVCAVPAVSVVAENVVAFEVARAFLEKFAGDTLAEVRASYEYFLGKARSMGEGSS